MTINVNQIGLNFHMQVIDFCFRQFLIRLLNQCKNLSGPLANLSKALFYNKLLLTAHIAKQIAVFFIALDLLSKPSGTT